ncbi:MAG: branched-chain amino acid ABC transporter permease [Deltaproteobacteria bacterium]|nr:branched-chain amino acid ABC transporter permease [Deltaproteobacteria bacterium]
MLNSRDITNGPLGLSGIRPPNSLLGLDFTSMTASYYLILIIGSLMVCALYLLVKSNIGRILISIRENEDLAQAIGINTAFYKVLAFSISSVLAGVTGSLFAHFFRLLHPSTFTWMASEMIVIMALVGGTGTLIGPIIGAGLVTFILELMRFAPELRFIMWSVMLIVILLVEPKGLMGIYARVRGGK